MKPRENHLESVYLTPSHLYRLRECGLRFTASPDYLRGSSSQRWSEGQDELGLHHRAQEEVLADAVANHWAKGFAHGIESAPESYDLDGALLWSSDRLASGREGLIRSAVLRWGRWVVRVPIVVIAEGTVVLHFPLAGSKVRGRVRDDAALAKSAVAEMGLGPCSVQLWTLDGPGTNSLEVWLWPGKAVYISSRPLGSRARKQAQSIEAQMRSREIAPQNEPCSSWSKCPQCSRRWPLPKRHIFQLHRPGRSVEQLRQAQILDLSDIKLPKDSGNLPFDLKERHRRQIWAIVNDQTYINVPELQQFLDSLGTPCGFLDFEAIHSAFPPLAGVRTWEHIPVAYSLHAQPQGAEGVQDTLEQHYYRQGFWPSEASDFAPMARGLVDHLSHCSAIVVFSRQFESAMLKFLMTMVPELEEDLAKLASRLVDLLDVFANFSVYHPDQQGKLSLKTVLPLFSEGSYDHLNLNNGAAASLAHYYQLGPLHPSPELEALAESIDSDDFRAYCTQDTWGMVQLVRALGSLVDHPLASLGL